MKVGILGSGGREHAICYKLKQSSKIKKLICIPGNAGTNIIAKNIKVDISKFNSLYKILKKHKIDIVVVGPEQPLVDGLVDYAAGSIPIKPKINVRAVEIKSHRIPGVVCQRHRGTG